MNCEHPWGVSSEGGRDEALPSVAYEISRRFMLLQMNYVLLLAFGMLVSC